METPETTGPRPIGEALEALFKARGWEIPDPELERQRAAAMRLERLGRGPAYLDCICDGSGGTGDELGVVLERDPVIQAYVDGKPVFTRERICPCPDGQRLRQTIEALRVKAAEQLRQRRVRALLGTAGLSRLASREGWSVERWSAESLKAGARRQVIDEVQTVLDQWRRDVTSETGRSLLLLAGNWGVGKSGLAEALVAMAVEALQVALFRAAPEIANDLRVAYDRRPAFGDAENEATAPTWDQLMRAYQDADLLVIDDLGTEAMTGAYEDRIREWMITIIDGRLRNLRPTIVTTNRTRTEISGRYGERLADRLDSRYAHRIWLDAPNLRSARGQA